MNENACNRDAEGRCLICSDEALPARIVRIDEATGLALVSLQDTTEEVDITLLEGAAVGDEVLIHGGVAIAHL